MEQDAYSRRKELLRELKEMVVAENRITFPADILPFVAKYEKKKQEHFFVACLDGNHHVTKIVTVSKGLVNRTVVHPREVFRPALFQNSTAVIVGHNHPSGNLNPSPEDRDITKRLNDAATIMGIKLLDHVIVGKKGGYYSFLEAGELE